MARRFCLQTLALLLQNVYRELNIGINTAMVPSEKVGDSACVPRKKDLRHLVKKAATSDRRLRLGNAKSATHCAIELESEHI